MQKSLRHQLLSVVLVLGLGGSTALAAPALPTPPPHIPVAPPQAEKPTDAGYLANFPLWELAAAGGLLATGLTLQGMQDGTPVEPTAAYDSLDARISRHFDGQDIGAYRSASDVLLTGMVAGSLAAYGVGALTDAFGRETLEYQFTALSEALAATIFATETTKALTGRARPDGSDSYSFFSGHTASTFAVGSFLAMDMSNWLYHDVLADSDPAARILLGRVLPYAIGYGGAAATGYLRVAGQKHYPTDVLVGAAVGALIGNLSYVYHFDGQGRPRNRWDRPRPQLRPLFREGAVGAQIKMQF